MNYSEFLNAVIDEGIKAATDDYVKPEQKDKLDGSIAGFNACRDLVPVKLMELLKKAKEQGKDAYFKEVDDRPKQPEDKKYWYWRCHELEVEWICNVVSAMLQNEGMPVIVTPTARGIMMADKILKQSLKNTNS